MTPHANGDCDSANCRACEYDDLTEVSCTVRVVRTLATEVRVTLPRGELGDLEHPAVDRALPVLINDWDVEDEARTLLTVED